MSGHVGPQGRGSGAGVSGFSGYSGFSGRSGYSGYSGLGTSGYSGYSGSAASIVVADTQVLFADGANNPAGDAGLTYNKTTDALSVGTTLTVGDASLTNSVLDFGVGGASTKEIKMQDKIIGTVAAVLSNGFAEVVVGRADVPVRINATQLVTPNVYYTATVFDSAGGGSPEGVVTAGIGSTYRRTDGGAATSFYVKESGTGNTGWVAK